MNSDRYIPVRAGFWWKVKIGDGTALYGKFHTERQAQEMCSLLRREWLNGEFSERARAERLAAALRKIEKFANAHMGIIGMTWAGNVARAALADEPETKL